MSRPIWVSLSWVLLGSLLALSAPWLGLAPPWVQAPVNFGAPVLTAACIAWTAALSLRLVSRTGRTLGALPLTVVQFVLGTLFFFQIACHLGAEHYAWDRSPRWGDWVGFAAAHALRAGDLFDTLEAYGWRIQAIEHASHLTALSLIVFRLLMGLFVLSLLLEGANRVKKIAGACLPRLVRGLRQVVLHAVALLMLVLPVAWLVGAFWVRPWRWPDLLWWPIDNALRVLDFMDVLEIYDLHLCAVPSSWWESSLTAVFRVLLGLFLGGALSRWCREASIRRLGGWGLGAEDLEEIAQGHADAAIRGKARWRLAELNRAARPGLQGGWAALASGLTVGLTAAGLAVASSVSPHWDAAARRLAEAAVQSDQAGADRALAGLRRMGPYAEAAVAPLRQSLPATSRERQRVLIDCLGYLGPAAVEALGQCAGDADEEIALQGVAALRRIGPPAVPALAKALGSSRGPVQQAAWEALLALGNKAVQSVIDTAPAEDAAALAVLAEQLDPYWHLRDSNNPGFAAMLKARSLRSAIGSVPALARDLRGAWDARSRRSAAEALGRIGPAAAGAVPALVKALEDRAAYVRYGAAGALGRIGPAAAVAVPALVKTALQDPDRGVRGAAAYALGKIGPGAAGAVPTFARALENQDGAVRRKAVEALVKMGPAAAAAVPALVKALEDRESHVREWAADALGKIGPRAAAAVPALARALEDRDKAVRQWAAKGLGGIGPGAAAAAPALARALEDREATVRNAAAEALAKIDPNRRSRR